MFVDLSLFLSKFEIVSVVFDLAATSGKKLI